MTLCRANNCPGTSFWLHWEADSWGGLKGAYCEPHHWYYRTVGDWIGLSARLGLPIRELREPLNPDMGKPLSLVFVLG